MSKPFTLHDVVPIARELTKLDRVNPTDGREPVYITSNGDRCIIGELCFRLGLADKLSELTDAELAATVQYTSLKNLFTSDALLFLTELQSASDDNDVPIHQLPAWNRLNVNSILNRVAQKFSSCLEKEIMNV